MLTVNLFVVLANELGSYRGGYRGGGGRGRGYSPY